MELLNLRNLDIKVDKTELSKHLKPEQLRKYIESKGWTKIRTTGGYDIYEYHINGIFTIMIASPDNWIKQEDYIKSHDLRENFLSLVAVHHISEFEILESMFEITCEKETTVGLT